MRLPRPVWTRLDDVEPEEIIHELEDSRLYRPDRDHEDQLFETVYGLDVRPSGTWKYDHVLGTHSILYDPEDEDFDLRRTDAITYVRDSAGRLADAARDRFSPDTDNGTERYGFLLNDDAIDSYEAFLEDDDRFVKETDEDGTVYRSDETTTVRMAEGRFPETGQRYADVDVEIPVGEVVPGASMLVDGQRKVVFDGELEAEAIYVEDPEITGLAER